MPVNVDQIVVSEKFKHSNEGFKHFIGYQESGIVKPLCIILFSLKWVDTSNTLKAVVKTCLLLLKMIKCGKNAKKFGM